MMAHTGLDRRNTPHGTALSAQHSHAGKFSGCRCFKLTTQIQYAYKVSQNPGVIVCAVAPTLVSDLPVLRQA